MRVAVVRDVRCRWEVLFGRDKKGKCRLGGARENGMNE